MPGRSFQFRLCDNPNCGLRYPLVEGSEYGERCPLCLGSTQVSAEASAERESLSHERPVSQTARPAALLDNIRSAWNVGSIFRSAEGFGFGHLYLGGISPTPENEQVKKTALGAEQVVAWSSHRNAVSLAHDLKSRGCVIWALERTASSQPIETMPAQQRVQRDLVLVVGNEQAGIDPGILELADRVVHIAMRGQKRSFNVAVAFAVAAHALTRA